MGHPTRLTPPPIDVTLALVRHGESTWVAEGRFQGRQDPPLSRLGERQAALVAARLASPVAAPALPLPPGRPVTIWHSPLARARATADAIAAAHEPTVTARAAPAFMEIAQGGWEGRHHAEIAAEDGDALAAWRREPTRFHAPGGEPLLGAAERVVEGLSELLGSLAADVPASGARPARVPGYGPDGPAAEPWAIVVAHDGIFRLALMSLLGIPYERFWNFPFVLCGITVIEIRADRAQLRAHNLADHLAPLAAEEPAAAAEARGARRGAL